MRATAEDLNLRQRQRLRIRTTQIAIQRLANGGGGGVCRCHGHGHNGIAAQTRLARCPVQLDQPTIQRRLISRIQAGDGTEDLAVHMGNRAGHVVTAKRIFAVAQIERLAGAGGCACWSDGSTDTAAFQQYFGFHCRAATAVPHAAAVHKRNRRIGHPTSSFVQAWRTSPRASTG